MFSLGSVATYARNGDIFSNHFTANLSGNLPENFFCKSVKISQNYGRTFVVALFLVHPMYNATERRLYTKDIPTR